MMTQSTERVSRRARIAFMTVVSATLILLVADLAQRRIVSTLNHGEATRMAQDMLARAEVAVDYAVATLDKLDKAGHLGCSAEARAAQAKAVFETSSIKDILAGDGGTVCSVATQSDALLNNYEHPRLSADATDAGIVLNPVEIAGEPAFAVTWRPRADLLGAALVNTQTMAFDVLPAEYRDRGRVMVRLDNGALIVLYEGEEAGSARDMEAFEFASGRYPITARIEAPASALATTGLQRSTPVEVVAVLLALVLSYFVIRGVIPPPSISGRIRGALDHGEIVPYFQPCYDLRSGEMIGFEVLARWIQPDGTPVSPTVFVPLVEANGWSDKLLESMVCQTARAMREVIELAPETQFAFNISPSQIIKQDFAGWFLQVLDQAELDPQRIVLEVTEREEIGNTRVARHCVEALRAKGVRIAIDDAGTGHNGLAAIRSLGASVLKIDKFFVDGIEHDPRVAALVRMLVNVAREYGMRIVAEGVEHAVQLTALGRLGVDEVQGFFLCPPLNAVQATAEFARHQAVMLRGRVQVAEARPEEHQASQRDIAVPA